MRKITQGAARGTKLIADASPKAKRRKDEVSSAKQKANQNPKMHH